MYQVFIEYINRYYERYILFISNFLMSYNLISVLISGIILICLIKYLLSIIKIGINGVSNSLEPTTFFIIGLFVYIITTSLRYVLYNVADSVSLYCVKVSMITMVLIIVVEKIISSNNSNKLPDSIALILIFYVYMMSVIQLIVGHSDSTNEQLNSMRVILSSYNSNIDRTAISILTLYGGFKDSINIPRYIFAVIAVMIYLKYSNNRKLFIDRILLVSCGILYGILVIIFSIYLNRPWGNEVMMKDTMSIPVIIIHNLLLILMFLFVFRSYNRILDNQMKVDIGIRGIQYHLYNTLKLYKNIPYDELLDNSYMSRLQDIDNRMKSLGYDGISKELNNYKSRYKYKNIIDAWNNYIGE